MTVRFSGPTPQSRSSSSLNSPPMSQMAQSFLVKKRGTYWIFGKQYLSVSRRAPHFPLMTRVLAEHPSAITDDLVARAGGITEVAQRQPLSFQVAAVRLDKKASDRQVATRLSGAQTGPVAIFYARRGRRIQALRGLITVIVRQVGADDEQCFRAAP